MGDIVEKLKKIKGWHQVSHPDDASKNPSLCYMFVTHPTALEAADEIKRLRAGGCARDQTTTQFCAEAAALQAENARLTTWLQLIANHPVEDSGVWEIGAREMLKCARAALAEQEKKS